MTQQTDDKILETLYNNTIEHRKRMMENLAKQMRLVSSALNSVAADVALIAVEGVLESPPSITNIQDQMKAIADLYPALLEAKVTIQNIDQMTHGRFKRSNQTPAPKGPSNVTQLPHTGSITTPRSKAATGEVEGTVNPGRERQRRRKQSSDNG